MILVPRELMITMFPYSDVFFLSTHLLHAPFSGSNQVATHVLLFSPARCFLSPLLVLVLYVTPITGSGIENSSIPSHLMTFVYLYGQAPLEKLQVIDLAIKYLKHLQAHSNNSNNIINNNSSNNGNSNTSIGNVNSSSEAGVKQVTGCDKGTVDLKSVDKSNVVTDTESAITAGTAVGICCEFMKLSEEERKKEYKKGFNESIKESIAYIRKSDVDATFKEEFTYKLVNHLLKLLEDSNDLKLDVPGCDTSLRKKVPTRDAATQTGVSQGSCSPATHQSPAPSHPPGNNNNSIISRNNSNGYFSRTEVRDRVVTKHIGSPNVMGAAAVVAKDQENVIKTNGAEKVAPAVSGNVPIRLKPMSRADSVIQNPIIPRKPIPIVPAPCPGFQVGRAGEMPLRLMRSQTSPCDEQVSVRSMPVLFTSSVMTLVPLVFLQFTQIPAAKIREERSSSFRGNEITERNEKESGLNPAAVATAKPIPVLPNGPPPPPGKSETQDQTGKECDKINRDPSPKSMPAAATTTPDPGSGTKGLSALQTLLTSNQTVSQRGSSWLMESLSSTAAADVAPAPDPLRSSPGKGTLGIRRQSPGTHTSTAVSPPVSQKRKSPAIESEADSFRSFKKQILQRFDTEVTKVVSGEDEATKTVTQVPLIATPTMPTNNAGMKMDGRITNDRPKSQPVKSEPVAQPVVSCLKAQLMQKPLPKPSYKQILPAQQSMVRVTSNLSSLQSLQNGMTRQAAGNAGNPRCTCSVDHCVPHPKMPPSCSPAFMSQPRRESPLPVTHPSLHTHAHPQQQQQHFHQQHQQRFQMNQQQQQQQLLMQQQRQQQQVAPFYQSIPVRPPQELSAPVRDEARKSLPPSSPQPSPISVRRNAAATMPHSPAQSSIPSYPTPPSSSDPSQISSPFQTRVNPFYQQAQHSPYSQPQQQQPHAAYPPHLMGYERTPERQPIVRSANQIFERVSPSSSPSPAQLSAAHRVDSRSYRFHPHVDLPSGNPLVHPAADRNGYLPPQFYISTKDHRPASLIQID